MLHYYLFINMGLIFGIASQTVDLVWQSTTSQTKHPGQALQSTADLQADNNRCINNFLDILVIPFFISDLMITEVFKMKFLLMYLFYNACKMLL